MHLRGTFPYLAILLLHNIIGIRSQTVGLIQVLMPNVHHSLPEDNNLQVKGTIAPLDTLKKYVGMNFRDGFEQPLEIAKRHYFASFISRLNRCG